MKQNISLNFTTSGLSVAPTGLPATQKTNYHSVGCTSLYQKRIKEEMKTKTLFLLQRENGNGNETRQTDAGSMANTKRERSENNNGYGARCAMTRYDPGHMRISR